MLGAEQESKLEDWGGWEDVDEPADENEEGKRSSHQPFC